MTDISEILKDCPKGTKLYSPVCGECRFIEIVDTSRYTLISCMDKNECIVDFDEYGRFDSNDDGECLLFPSKENRDWSTFNKAEFKTGDFVYVNGFVCIFAGTTQYKYYDHGSILFFACIPEDWFHCGRSKECVSIHQTPDVGIGNINKYARLATEAEKNLLLEAIKCKGYEWDSEKLEIRGPEFKVFDRVLVRNTDQSLWKLAEYAFRDKECVEGDFDHYTVGGIPWKYCIPYEGNEYLLGTSENC